MHSNSRTYCTVRPLPPPGSTYTSCIRVHRSCTDASVRQHAAEYDTHAVMHLSVTTRENTHRIHIENYMQVASSRSREHADMHENSAARAAVDSQSTVKLHSENHMQVVLRSLDEACRHALTFHNIQQYPLWILHPCFNYAGYVMPSMPVLSMPEVACTRPASRVVDGTANGP